MENNVYLCGIILKQTNCDETKSSVYDADGMGGGYRLGAFDSKATPTAIMEGFVE